MNLKICPFCRSDSVIMSNRGHLYMGHCRRCNCYGPTSLSEEIATSLWNRDNVNKLNKRESRRGPVADFNP